MARRKQQTRSRAGRLRPTSERIRETLFNWLAPRLHGARCLDLFAGTGALGLEALSRGASSTVFVERSPVAARQLGKNIDILLGKTPVGAASAASGFGPEGPPANAEVIHGDALEYLRRSTDNAFDIVFLDPPFAEDLLSETCRLLAEGQLLAEGAVVYLELGRDQEVPMLPDGWQVEKNKTAGNVRYMLVRTQGNV
jgi:16S rRNA (guanine966-N2)-methyltransferase